MQGRGVTRHCFQQLIQVENIGIYLLHTKRTHTPRSVHWDKVFRRLRPPPLNFIDWLIYYTYFCTCGRNGRSIFDWAVCCMHAISEFQFSVKIFKHATHSLNAHRTLCHAAARIMRFLVGYARAHSLPYTRRQEMLQEMWDENRKVHTKCIKYTVVGRQNESRTHECERRMRANGKEWRKKKKKIRDVVCSESDSRLVDFVLCCLFWLWRWSLGSCISSPVSNSIRMWNVWVFKKKIKRNELLLWNGRSQTAHGAVDCIAWESFQFESIFPPESKMFLALIYAQWAGN